ncbi:P-loop containing nucleoside triphosphate hydrolase protein, partial [Ochromonadaceae sp. CCMP2298]
RPFNFCVVDEADSILIDEARTPLIISRRGNGPTNKYVSCAQIAQNLEKDVHYDVNEKDQKVELSAAGFKFAEQIIGKGLYELADPWAYFVINGLKAKELFLKDKQYIVDGAGISIIDAFTGRVLTGRRFTDGLQQAIEAKEKITVSSETQTVAKVTYQNLFRLFPKLAGMTGTAFTDASEFLDTYGLKVMPIPTALPIARRDNGDAVFRTQEGKMKALLRNVLTNHEKGRPILIGTTSVEASEDTVQALRGLGVNAKVLNARPENVERESEVVAQAGRVGAVTVATNMAGRGTDILLGGSAKCIARVLAKQMLLVRLGMGVEVKAGEGPGPERAIVSCSDLLLPEEGTASASTPITTSTSAGTASAGTDTATTPPTPPVGRIEVEELVAQAADSAPLTSSPSAPALRLLRNAINILTKELDTAVKEERNRVKKLGGLYVIGTSRHESRRIDNQLRGRAGRQGDVGASRFFLSLEDDVFKIFGADKMAGLLENFRIAEDMPIESEMVVAALDKVQVQVEEYFRAQRQQVFRLDEVASLQRGVVYSQRRAFLTSSDEGMLSTFSLYCRQTMDEIYAAALAPTKKGVNAEKLVAKAVQFFPNIKITAEEIEAAGAGAGAEGVLPLLHLRLEAAVQEKRAEVDSVSSWAFVAFFRYLALVQVDESWCKQLTRLDLLKEEMVLQSFTAEKDVMETYRESALQLFGTLMDDVRRNTVYSLFIYKPTAGR